MLTVRYLNRTIRPKSDFDDGVQHHERLSKCNDIIHAESNIASNIRPSARGELEITDLNRVYLDRGHLAVERMGRGFTWLDTGTHESLMDASLYIQAIEKRQGLMVACPEEIALRSGYITAEQVEKIGSSMKNNSYGAYLLQLLREKVF